MQSNYEIAYYTLLYTSNFGITYIMHLIYLHSVYLHCLYLNTLIDNMSVDNDGHL